jgi:hypothetical protein
MPTLEETATATLEEAATAVLRTIAAGKSASKASIGTKIGGISFCLEVSGKRYDHTPEIAELPTEMGEYIHYHTSAVCRERPQRRLSGERLRTRRCQASVLRHREAMQ